MRVFLNIEIRNKQLERFVASVNGKDVRYKSC
jgi:hypothetical protein